MSDPFERKIYEARLTPHRSMTPRAFYLFIIAFLFGAARLRAALLHHGRLARRRLHGTGRARRSISPSASASAPRAVYETLDLTPLELVFAQIGARGQRREWRFNPSWVRLEQTVHEEFGTERVALVSRGESVEIGAFLGPDQKAELARDLNRALVDARMGARFS